MAQSQINGLRENFCSLLANSPFPFFEHDFCLSVSMYVCFLGRGQCNSFPFDIVAGGGGGGSC